MDSDDPRRPLLGQPARSRFRRTASRLCSVDSWKRRVPITIWLPTYSWEKLIRDMIAGITVGLTSIPQGIAYAIVAGVPPQVGLYSSIFPGLVYMIFGSCKDVTVGPTAILAALLAKYVAKSVDFAYLAAFLSGCLIFLLGVLQLGFLLDFISKPVISGFTSAAALQIGAAQLKTLFRISGKSGDTFISAIINFFKHIATIQLWDTVLGVSSIIVLLLLKKSKIPVTDSSPRWRVVTSQVWLYCVRARNAIVVFVAAIIAYIMKYKGLTPFALTGTIEGGLPAFGPPPFSTVVKNHTLDFEDMLSEFGAEGLVMPLVAILESIAIAKAFAGSKTVDNTQEMIAIGACNMLASFAQCMPATGSFTRTALNHASGVLTPAGSFFKASREALRSPRAPRSMAGLEYACYRIVHEKSSDVLTPAGSFFKAMLVLLAVTQLSSAFYFIPRAVLAAIIMVAMMSIIEFGIVKTLWRNSKMELVVYLITLCVGALVGLEYGILAGAAADALRAMHAAARPSIHVTQFKVGNQDCITLTPLGVLSYACAEYITQAMRKHAYLHTQLIVVDGRHLHSIDIGVAENLLTVILDLERQQHRFLLWNFSERHQTLFRDLNGHFEDRFVNGPSIDQHVLGLDLIVRGNGY